MISALLVSTVLALPSAQGPRFDLVVQVEDPASARVGVRARLRELDEPVTLSLPPGFAFVRLEPSFAVEPRLVEPHGGARLRRDSATSWSLQPGDATEVTVAWEMALDQRTHPQVVGRDEYEFPYLAEDHGMLSAGAMLIVPEDGRCEGVRFELPEGWPVEAPWPEEEPGLFVPPSPGSLRSDLVAIGNWERHRETVGGVDVTVAFAPGQERLRESLGDRLARIVEAELDLFGSVPNERYLFLFGRPDQTGTYAGSPRTSSMTLIVSPDLDVAFAREGVEHLIAHEYHHTWMMARCDPEPELRFVMEGFTDWYAHVVLWRLGWKSPSGFRQAICAQVAKAEEALRLWPGSLTSAGGAPFFEGGPAYQACYSAGLALAAWTELALLESEAEIDLDELLRRFYEDPRWRDGTRPTLDHWYALIGEHLTEEFVETQRFVLETTEDVDWPSLFVEVGLELERTETPCAPTPRANFKDTVFTAIDPDGAAGRLGLRHGDRLVEVNGRAVETLQAIRAAWGRDGKGRISLIYERQGEERTLEAAYPSRIGYRLASGAWWPWEG